MLVVAGALSGAPRAEAPVWSAWGRLMIVAWSISGLPRQLWLMIAEQAVLDSWSTSRRRAGRGRPRSQGRSGRRAFCSSSFHSRPRALLEPPARVAHKPERRSQRHTHRRPGREWRSSRAWRDWIAIHRQRGDECDVMGVPGRRMPDRRMPDRRMPGRRMPGRRMPGRRMPDRRMPGRRMPDRRQARARAQPRSERRAWPAAVSSCRCSGPSRGRTRPRCAPRTHPARQRDGSLESRGAGLSRVRGSTVTGTTPSAHELRQLIKS